MSRLVLPVISLALAFAGTSAHAAPEGEVIAPARLSEITRDLASDAFAGRAPGGQGEPRTIAYLIERFKALGLQPAGDDGGWTQSVPLVRLKPEGPVVLTLATPAGPLMARQSQELQVSTLRPVDRVIVEAAPLVFVGYGVTAAERGWDDFKGADLNGKIAVFLISDPDFEAGPDEPVAGKFAGTAATYYARWTYKYEEAVRQGAIGAIIVHEAPGAGYGWSTVIAPAGEGYDIVRPDPAREKLLLQGWIQRDAAVELFKRSGQDFEALKVAARRADFRPVSLKGASLSADFAVKHERMDSANVLARLPGAKRPDESVLYAAHWDAFGIGAPDAQGRSVRPGAVDDAIGVAAVLETARAFAAGTRPERSILFAAWTAEERGLLGSEYYAARHEAELTRMVANFTFDVLQTAGPARDVVLVGAGQNTLEDRLADAARGQGRVITPDAKPERALFYRADHFSLAKRGVPVLLLMGLGGGADLVEGGRAAGDAWVADYTSRCYHQPCDAWSPNWDLRGAAQDVTLTYEVGLALANSSDWPDWNPGSEFKPIRAASAADRP